MTAEEIEKRLRRELWLHHGCPLAALYGDDGEMSCGSCPADFGRWPIDDVVRWADERRLANVRQALREWEASEWGAAL